MTQQNIASQPKGKQMLRERNNVFVRDASNQQSHRKRRDSIGDKDRKVRNEKISPNPFIEATANGPRQTQSGRKHDTGARRNEGVEEDKYVRTWQ